MRSSRTSTSPLRASVTLTNGARDREALVGERGGGRRERCDERQRRATRARLTRGRPRARRASRRRNPSAPATRLAGSCLDRGVVGLHRVVVDHARERDAVLALRELLLRAARSAPRLAARGRPPRCRRRRRWPCRAAALGRRAQRGRRRAPHRAPRPPPRAPSARARRTPPTASLSSGTRSARRRSSASTSPQAACVRLRARVSRL